MSSKAEKDGLKGLETYSLPSFRDVPFPAALPWATAIREYVDEIHQQTPIEGHATSLLFQLAASLQEQPVQKDRYWMAVSTPNDQARELAVHALLETIQRIREHEKPTVLVVDKNGWKTLNTDLLSSKADCILLNLDEPVTENQNDLLTRLAAHTPVIACTTDASRPLDQAIQNGLLRPINRKPLITRLSRPDLKAWFSSGRPLPRDMVPRIAGDPECIETLVRGILEESEQPVAFVQTVDRETLDVFDKLRAKLPPKLADKVAVIENPHNIGRGESIILEEWAKGHKRILIAPTIPPHTRAPKNLEAVFLQPSAHAETIKTILIRALQTDQSTQITPVLVRELTPLDPAQHGFLMLPQILEGVEAFVPPAKPQAPIIVRPEPVAPPQPSLVEPRATKKVIRKTDGKLTPLVTKGGIDLAHVLQEDFDQQTTNLAPKQKLYLSEARTKPIPQIARDHSVTEINVYGSIRVALIRVEHPARRGGARMKRERSNRSTEIKTLLDSPRDMLQFLWTYPETSSISSRVLRRWLDRGVKLSKGEADNTTTMRHVWWKAYVDTIQRAVRAAKNEHIDLLPILSHLFENERVIPSITDILYAIEKYIGELEIRLFIDHHGEFPGTLKDLDDTIKSGRYATREPEIAPLFRVVTAAASSILAAYYYHYFRHVDHPFSHYLQSKEVANIDISSLATGLAWETIERVGPNDTVPQAIQRIAGRSHYHAPLADKLRPYLTLDNPQAELERLTGGVLPWSTIYFDILPLCEGEATTNQQKDMAILLASVLG